MKLVVKAKNGTVTARIYGTSDTGKDIPMLLSMGVCVCADCGMTISEILAAVYTGMEVHNRHDNA